MGGGASRGDGAEGGVRPVNGKVLVEEHRTGHFGAFEQNTTLCVRRGCTLEFEFDLPKALRKGLADPGSSGEHLEICSVVTDCLAQNQTVKCWDECVVKSVSSDFAVTVKIKCSVEVPVSVYRIGFSVTNKISGGTAEVKCSYCFAVLFNSRNTNDKSVFLNDACFVEEYLDRLEGAIVIGCDKHKIKRYWRFAQNHSELITVAFDLIREAQKKRVDPEALAAYLLERTCKLVLNYSKTIKKQQDREIKLGCIQGADDFLNTGFKDYLRKKGKQNGEGADDEDEEIFQNIAGVQYEEIEHCWLITGFYCSLLRTLGIPCRPVSFFNILHDGQQVSKKLKPDQTKVSSLSEAKDGTGLRLFNVWTEVWVGGQWHLAQFLVDRLGQLKTKLSPTLNIVQQLEGHVNPKLLLSDASNMDDDTVRKKVNEGLTLPTTVYTCKDSIFVIEDRTPIYLNSLLDESESDKDKFNKICTTFELIEESGLLGENVKMRLEASFTSFEEDGYDDNECRLSYTIAISAVSYHGKHRKLLRTFKGSGDTLPFMVDRRLEHEDLAEHVDKNFAALECICCVDIQLMDEDGNEVGQKVFKMFYESIVLIPSLLSIEPNLNSSKQEYSPKIKISDRLKHRTPQLIKELMPSPEDDSIQRRKSDTKGGRRKTTFVRMPTSVKLHSPRYEDFTCTLNTIQTKLQEENEKLIEQGKFPFTLAWFDHEQDKNVARRVSVLPDEIPTID